MHTTHFNSQPHRSSLRQNSDIIKFLSFEFWSVFSHHYVKFAETCWSCLLIVCVEIVCKTCQKQTDGKLKAMTGRPKAEMKTANFNEKACAWHSADSSLTMMINCCAQSHRHQPIWSDHASDTAWCLLLSLSRGCQDRFQITYIMCQVMGHWDIPTISN